MAVRVIPQILQDGHGEILMKQHLDYFIVREVTYPYFTQLGYSSYHILQAIKKLKLTVLTLNQFNVYYLKQYQNFGYSAISHATGISLNNVKRLWKNMLVKIDERDKNRAI